MNIFKAMYLALSGKYRFKRCYFTDSISKNNALYARLKANEKRS